jgi:uncharacterized membrane protein
MKRDAPHNPERREWLLRRNCSLTPGQTLVAWASLMLVSASVGGVIALHGAWLVLVFSALEMGAISAAFLVYGRHAADYEYIVFDGASLLVEKHVAGQVRSTRLDPYWAHVEAQGALPGPVTLEARGVKVSVGACLPQAGRQLFARELHATLAAMRR